MGTQTDGGDGGVSKSDGGTDGGGRFCDGFRTLTGVRCFDFDEALEPDLNLLGTLFSSGGGSIATTRDEIKTPPRALRFLVPPLDGGNASALISTLDLSPTRLTVSFDALIAPGTSGTSFVGAAARGGSKAELVLLPSGFYLQEGPFLEGKPDYRSNPSQPVNWGAGWRHIELVVERTSADAGVAAVRIDGISQHAQALDPRFIFGTWYTQIGIVFASGNGPARSATLDNIVIDSR